MSEEYTDEELKRFEELTDGLIQWMFHSPNDRHPIIQTIKEAFEFGKKGTEMGEKKNG